MQINGYQLLEAIHNHELTRDFLKSEFGDSQTVFEGETKRDPRVVADEWFYHERTIAVLQHAQTVYNTSVRLTWRPEDDAEAETITINEAVKLMGPITRRESLWRSLLEQDEFDYIGRTRHRSKDVETAKSALSRQEISKAASEAARAKSRLREAIASANATPYDIPWLTQAMLA